MSLSNKLDNESMHSNLPLWVGSKSEFWEESWFCFGRVHVSTCLRVWYLFFFPVYRYSYFPPFVGLVTSIVVASCPGSSTSIIWADYKFLVVDPCFSEMDF